MVVVVALDFSGILRLELRFCHTPNIILILLLQKRKANMNHGILLVCMVKHKCPKDIKHENCLSSSNRHRHYHGCALVTSMKFYIDQKA